MKVSIDKRYAPVFVFTKNFELHNPELETQMPLIPKTGTIYKGYQTPDGFMLDIPEEERNTPFYSLMGFFTEEENEDWSYTFERIDQDNLLTLPLDIRQIRYMYKELDFIKSGKLNREVTPGPEEEVQKSAAKQMMLDKINELLEKSNPEVKERLTDLKDSEGYIEEYYPDIKVEHETSLRAIDYFMYRSDKEEIPIMRNLLFNENTMPGYTIGKITEALNTAHSASDPPALRKALYTILVYTYIELARQ